MAQTAPPASIPSLTNQLPFDTDTDPVLDPGPCTANGNRENTSRLRMAAYRCREEGINLHRKPTTCLLIIFRRYSPLHLRLGIGVRVYAVNIRGRLFILLCDDDLPENPDTAAENANGATSNATRLSPPVPIVLSDSCNAPSPLISPPVYPFHKVAPVLRPLPLPLPCPLTRISPEHASKMMKLSTAIAVCHQCHAEECVIPPMMHVNLSPLYPGIGQPSRFPSLSTMRCHMSYRSRHLSCITSNSSIISNATCGALYPSMMPRERDS